MGCLSADDAENATQGVGGVFVVSDGDGINAHLDYGVIIATGLSHVAEVENIFFLDVEFFQEVSHAEDFVHARSDGINRGGTADFVFKFRGEFFGAGADLFAFFTIWVPGVFSFGAGFLTESRESDLREAIFDNFVAGL